MTEAYGLFLLPPVTVSCSHEHAGFPGTVSISAGTLAAIVTDIAASLAESGVDGLVLVNGHGGNYVLSNVVQQVNASGSGGMALFPGRADWDRARSDGGLVTSTSEDMHAGELETSILHVRPETVRPNYADPAQDVHAPDRPHLLVRACAATPPAA